MERRRFIKNAGMLLGGLWAARTVEGVSNYRVLRGDTLSEIALRFNTSVRSLKRLNGLSSDRILAGQTLKVASTEPESPLSASVLKEFNRPRINRSKWRHVVIHHSATREGNALIFHRNHLRRGMENGLAYHFVIGNGVDSANGEIEVGHRWREQLNGGHVKSGWWNGNSIGICLVGNFQNGAPTSRQLDSLARLVGHLRADGVLDTRPRLFVHKEIKGEQTLCPGRYFPVKEFHKKFA